MSHEETKECPPPTAEEVEKIAQGKRDEYDHVIAVETKHFCAVAMDNLPFLVIKDKVEKPFKVTHTILLQDLDPDQGLTGEEYPIEVTHLSNLGDLSTKDDLLVLGIRTHIGKSGMIAHAKRELEILTAGDDPEDHDPNRWFNTGILDLVSLFVRLEFASHETVAKQAGKILKKLVYFQPLTPLTGQDDEWIDVSDFGDPTTEFQNKRCGHVLRGPDGLAFDLFAKSYIFPNGEVKRDPIEGSKTLTFPYMPPCEVIILEEGTEELKTVQELFGMKPIEGLGMET